MLVPSIELDDASRPLVMALSISAFAAPGTHSRDATRIASKWRVIGTPLFSHGQDTCDVATLKGVSFANSTTRDSRGSATRSACDLFRLEADGHRVLDVVAEGVGVADALDHQPGGAADLGGVLGSPVREVLQAGVCEAFAERLGEDGFRDLESTALERALAGPPRVLATGGGVVMREPNRRQLARRAHVVWLDLRFETVAARLRANPDGVRPLAARLGTDALRELHHRRRPLYASCAHLRVDADRDAPGRLARRIALHLRRAGH